MELPLFRFNIWMDVYEEYNCSALGGIDWHERGTSRPYLGAFCIIFGALAIPLYFDCALVMTPMRGNSVYKIMIFLAIADISDLLFASVGYGIMSITGEVYCMHPRFQLIFSICLEFFFFCSTTSCALLALNRFGEMLSIDWIIWIFQGSRTWIVLVLSTVPVGLLVLFTPPMLFNSRYHMLFFDPMIYDGKFVYDSYVHFAIVTFMPTFSLILYLLMIAGLFLEYGNISKMRQSNAFGRATFQIGFQSGVIIVIHLTSMLSPAYFYPMSKALFISAFQVLQFIPVSAIDSMLYFAHFGWMMVHGTPPLVYLTVNQTIREGLLDRLMPNRIKSVAVIPSQTTTTTQPALGDIDWSERGVRRPLLGCFCIVFGILTIPPYIACALTMVPMRPLSVYKVSFSEHDIVIASRFLHHAFSDPVTFFFTFMSAIMLFLAVADISDLIFSSIGFGIMAITGEVYCTHPRLQLLFSLELESFVKNAFSINHFTSVFFFCSTTACAMLAIPPIVWLFQDTRTWIVLAAASFAYDSYVAVLSLIMYWAMIAGLIHKHGKISKGSDALSRATFQIGVQSGVIIIIHLTSMLTFQILQFIPASAINTMLYFAHFGWMLVHGTPSIVYLSVNQTIREKVLDLLRPKRHVSVVASIARNH
ncbi:hypothetical protein PRIPAC_96591 [Pristionchus pacificus]|uniref:G protein-coupled receptor n=1 Tax=Pristionchus pacificus TaxID=54126 RepID=A0A2A6B380_PRIPA|nr:hypothetical protein PRIPAC_96591 [Pristionchus pacificus]|eukprot:PDM60337.1 G protein-coupled receptor [Pristionchus pacificus]